MPWNTHTNKHTGIWWRLYLAQLAASQEEIREKAIGQEQDFDVLNNKPKVKDNRDNKWIWLTVFWCCVRVVFYFFQYVCESDPSYCSYDAW